MTHDNKRARPGLYYLKALITVSKRPTLASQRNRELPALQTARDSTSKVNSQAGRPNPCPLHNLKNRCDGVYCVRAFSCTAHQAVQPVCSVEERLLSLATVDDVIRMSASRHNYQHVGGTLGAILRSLLGQQSEEKLTVLNGYNRIHVTVKN